MVGTLQCLSADKNPIPDLPLFSCFHFVFTREAALVGGASDNTVYFFHFSSSGASR